DPQIIRRTTCLACNSPMGGIRVYSGLNDPTKHALRGRICQTCTNTNFCHWTTFHTNVSYIVEDGEALIARLGFRELGMPIPPEFMVPLRLADPAAIVPQVADGAGVQCATPDCKTAGGKRTRGSMSCIEFKCKSCCTRMYRDAIARNTPRNSCPNHHVAASPGLPPTLPANPHTPEQPLALPAVHGQQPAAIPAQPRLPASAARGLKQPIGPLWQQARQAAVREEGSRLDLKAQRLAMEERQKRTVDLVIFYQPNAPALTLHHYVPTFPNLQLCSLPEKVLDTLKLTPTSIIDNWNGSWRIIDLQTVLFVEKDRSMLFKLRPSLLQEMTLPECPGLAEHLSRQPRVVGTKRGGQEIVSPMKKAAKTVQNTTISAAAQNLAPTIEPIIICDDDSSPSPILTSLAMPTVPHRILPTVPITSSGRVVPKIKVKSSKRAEREWIMDCSLTAWDNGWQEIRALMDTDRQKTESSEFGEVFVGHSYVKPTVAKYKKIFRELPEDIRSEFLAMGDVPSASFAHAMKASRGYKAEPEFREPSPSSDNTNPPGSFPHLSPLNIVHDLPPTSLTAPNIKPEPESDDEEGLSDPASLCSFCDEKLPLTPSSTLVAMREKLENNSRPSPLPHNQGHRSAHVANFASYCERHRLERDIFPVASARGWPFSPDFSSLFKRIMGLRSELTIVCEEPDNSSFFRASREFYTPKPTESGAQLPSTTQLRSTMHHYGELGYEIMSVAVRFMYPDGMDLTPFHPLTYNNLICEVLIPEATRRIIQEDLSLTPLAAKKTLKDSHVFGTVQHP
ncbi:hypothetical protein C8R43DRAFT_849346, partial [Mycena crocata]